MGSDRLHISLQTVGRVDSFREINGAAVHDINKNSFTPFILGLALQMHHVYGSKKFS
jgi:hypothetical protein